MTRVVVGDGPCWTLSHEDEWESRPHYPSQFVALVELAYEINRILGEARGIGSPGRTALDLIAEEAGFLLDSKPEQEPTRCCQFQCDGCGGQASYEDECTAPGVEGDHFGVDDDAPLHFDYEWTVVGRRHFCGQCEVPEDVATEAAEAFAREPGPDDVPLFPLEVVVQ